MSELNASAEDVDDSGGMIDTSVATSTDDAEENSTGTVTLNNEQLYLLDRTSVAASGSIEVRVEHDNDSLEERVSSGSMRYGSSDLELMKDGSNLQIIGLRFMDVPVPADAGITDATIEFEIDERRTGADDDLTVTIYGEATAGAVRFDNDNKVSDRTKTSTSVDWAIPAGLGVNEEFTITGNPLSNIIEEIVTTANGWNKDNDDKNDLAIIIEHKSGSRHKNRRGP